MDTTELAAATKGPVLGPGDDGFDEARHVWNARFERVPDVIVRCQGADDVAAAVRWAADEDVAVHVKGGGHSYAGHTVGDGGLLLDMSPMSGIKVRPEEHRVTVGAGATWADLDSATQHHGLATTGPTASSVGVAGSTLCGGTGWLSRRHGHALDNVVAFEVVTTTGEQVRAAADVNSDLFWGLRGAGQNLGVVTSLEFQLHEVGPQVLGGQIIYPFDEAERMLRAYDDFMADAPDDLAVFPFTFRVPPIDAFPAEHHGQPVLDFVVFHTDPTAVDAIAPLQQLGTPILDAVGPMAYTALQQSFDANLPAGQRYYSAAQDLPGLSDDAIADFARYVRDSRGAFTASYFEVHGGVAGRVDADATAMRRNDTRYGFHVIAGWTDEQDDEAVIGWAREFGDAMAEHGTDSAYIALLAEDENERIPTALSDPDRVRKLKATWDPDNRLHTNHNVAPA